MDRRIDLTENSDFRVQKTKAHSIQPNTFFDDNPLEMMYNEIDRLRILKNKRIPWVIQEKESNRESFDKQVFGSKYFSHAHCNEFEEGICVVCGSSTWVEPILPEVPFMTLCYKCRARKADLDFLEEGQMAISKILNFN